VLATVLSATVQGLDGTRVAVEIDLQRGLRTFHIVGLASLAVRESRERVEAALQNSGFELPERRLTVNLAPADLPKEGSGFDLPIALGVLAASGQCRASELDGVCVLGELALDGCLRPVRGVLPIAITMMRQGVRRFLVPASNVDEARLVPDLEAMGCVTLAEAAARCGAVPRPNRRRSNGRGVSSGAVERSRSEAGSTRTTANPEPARGAATAPEDGRPELPNFSQVFGQEVAKRALAIAAAGGHHVLLVGPPGVGKSMLARCLPGLLPPLAAVEALEVRQVLSVCGRHREAASPSVVRPFRAPHHTLSVPGLVGGGRPLVPGEITLAHNGVLFLDELPEFPRFLLDQLRQPLEEGAIHIARANQRIRYPARFQLVAAMNPCPCGNWGHPKKVCRCAPGDVQRYQAKISGPILDRIDLRIEVGVPPAECVGTAPPETNKSNAELDDLRQRIAAARARQATRYENLENVYCNAQTGPEQRRTLLRPRHEAADFLRRAMTRWNLSVRAFDRALAVARTIADLEGASDIDVQHVAEALQYRLQRSDERPGA